MSDPWAKFMKEAPVAFQGDDPWVGFRVSPKKVGMGEDIAKSYTTGLMQGGQGMMGGLGDIASLVTSLPLKGVKALEARKILPTGATAAMTKYVDENSLSPGLASIGHGLSGAILAKALQATGMSEDKALATAELLPGGKTMFPTTRQIEDASGVRKFYHEPQTVAGQYARTAGQFTPTALFPGSVAQRAESAIVPALTSETAGQVTKGTKMEPWARIAGALLGGAGVAVANQPGPSTRMLAEASRGATDPQIAAATALRHDAAGRGIDLTLAEAMQQVTNNGTGLGRMQRVLESTRSGSELTTPYMARRPDQVRNAVTRFADNIAPATDQPSMLGAGAQDAANTALTGVRQEINAQARPHYDALQGQELPPAAYEALASDPAYRHALAQVRGHPVLGAPLEGLPDTNLHVVNETVKQLDTLAENARPGAMNPGGNNQLAAAFDTAAGRARDLVAPLSSDWTQARDIVSQGRAANLEPLQRGPLGAIASSDAVPAQTRALFPSAPMEGAPAETAQALQTLGDPGSGLVRQHLVNSLNESTQNLQSGPNQWGGAKFAATIAGNPEQANTLRAGVGAVGGDTTDLDALLQALQATGKRQAPGSQTAYNIEDLKNLGSSGASGEILSTGLNPPGTFRRLGEAFQRFQVERNARALADAILSDPDTAARALMDARRRAPGGGLVHSFEAALVTGGQARPQLPPPGR